MLIGRQVEQEQIARRLEEARSGRGGALVLRGEAGIGKTVLLEHAMDRAVGFRVLRALGVEGEAELAFAALHELLQPLLPLVGDLPEPQAGALKAALALAPRDDVDRFSAYAATLGLLSAATAELPLLCLIDDAHWLDDASAEALVFAARRLQNESVLMLFAARKPAATAFGTPGIRGLLLRGLEPDEARALLAREAPSVRAGSLERVVEVAHGNPLALLEFGRALSEATASEDLEEPLAVDEGVAWSFLERASRLTAGARRALLFAAVGGPAESDAIWAALEAAGIGADAVSEAQQEGLLTRGSRLDFCHPLARSAVFQAAAPAERRAAHAALAASSRWPERTAWHLAAASTGPDERVAAALEQAASAAASRGGVAAEARALERAARLTPERETRAHRLFRAGLAAEAAGRVVHAEHLLTEAAELTSDADLHADAVARTSYLLFDRGELDRALALATAEAEQAPAAAAARVLTASGVVHALVHRLEIGSALGVAERAAELAGPDFTEDLDLCHMLAWTWEISGRTHDALALAREGADRVSTGTILAIDFAGHFLYLEDYGRARELLEAVVARTRQAGALGNLAYALDMLAHVDIRTGRLTAAYAAALESVQLTEPLGNDVALAGALSWLALVEGMLGRSADARVHAGRALEITDARGDRYNAVRARAALALEALAAGDAADAVNWLEPAARMLVDGGVRHPNLFRVQADLIESQVRAGLREDAAQNLTRLLEDAAVTGSRWARATGARCRGLLVDDADAEDAFAEALTLHADDSDDFERARTELCYGERLRRLQRRRDAREHLHEALATFEQIGAPRWAERARAELRASGERLRRRDRGAPEQLTPQELQAALAAAEGLTNKEIGARLFLSPKTVEFHLSRAYRKLAVRSRGDLIKLFAAAGDAAERPTALRRDPAGSDRRQALRREPQR